MTDKLCSCRGSFYLSLCTLCSFLSSKCDSKSRSQANASAPSESVSRKHGSGLKHVIDRQTNQSQAHDNSSTDVIIWSKHGANVRPRRLDRPLVDRPRLHANATYIHQTSINIHQSFPFLLTRNSDIVGVTFSIDNFINAQVAKSVNFYLKLHFQTSKHKVNCSVKKVLVSWQIKRRYAEKCIICKSFHAISLNFQFRLNPVLAK